MKKLATLLAVSALIGSAFAATSPTPKKIAGDDAKKWVLNVGLIMPTDDHKDAGVDSGFTGSIDYHFGTPGNNGGNVCWFAGIGALFGEGDNDFDSQTFGIHLGVELGLGKPGEDNPWGLELKGGIYKTDLSWRQEIVKAGEEFEDESDDETGFGGSIAVTYKSKSSNGNGLRFTAGWYMMPEVQDGDHRGWFFTIGFPFGGK
ncbi:MAG TPA: hypothetical protein PLX06_05995 [Fimbriimonadaceae bacterium]|nr:hypothetical protein [Fimbriimonadaceae bacterium]